MVASNWFAIFDEEIFDIHIKSSRTIQWNKIRIMDEYSKIQPSDWIVDFIPCHKSEFKQLIVISGN